MTSGVRFCFISETGLSQTLSQMFSLAKDTELKIIDFQFLIKTAGPIVQLGSKTKTKNRIVADSKKK